MKPLRDRYIVQPATDWRGDRYFVVHDTWLRLTIGRHHETRAAAEAAIADRIKEICTMTMKPDHWTEARGVVWTEAVCRAQLAQSCGWNFYAAAEDGNVLAISLDYIGSDGPVVFDTGAPELPATL